MSNGDAAGILPPGLASHDHSTTETPMTYQLDMSADQPIPIEDPLVGLGTTPIGVPELSTMANEPMEGINQTTNESDLVTDISDQAVNAGNPTGIEKDLSAAIGVEEPVDDAGSCYDLCCSIWGFTWALIECISVVC